MAKKATKSKSKREVDPAWVAEVLGAAWIPKEVRANPWVEMIRSIFRLSQHPKIINENGQLIMASQLYGLYLTTVYLGPSEVEDMPGLDEGLAYRLLAEQIMRNLDREPLTDQQLEQIWEDHRDQSTTT